MDQLQREAHKLGTETERLIGQVDRLTERSDPTHEAAATALSQAKRVRRASTLLVQRIAATRDKLQP